MNEDSVLTKQRSITNFVLINCLITLLLFYLMGSYGIITYTFVNIIIIYLLIINITSFLIYGTDKMLARKKKKRIPEFTLVAAIFLGGTIGSFLGRSFFKHKTIKTSFIKKMKIALIIQIIIIILLITISLF